MLNQHERRQLKQIEQWFKTTDPRLAHGLRHCAGPRQAPADSHPIAPGLITVGTYTLALCLLVPGIAAFNLPLIFFGIVRLVAAGTAHINPRGEDR